ncbi:MAG TPA: 3-isopropylmalate dehydratase small subunit [Aggregatilineales bacterium]|nr:3-isopropylmalate dehydratase small subunit [Aggregatilineales bacterium]
MRYTGKTWVYGDNVNTDVIFPGKYTYTVSDLAQMAAHALEDLDPTFAKTVRAGDILVGGNNWGNGSSREQAVTCLVAAGVRVLIAKSIARIYFRNAVNGGLLPVVCPAAVAAIESGEVVTVDTETCTITCGAGIFEFPQLSPSKTILEAGGLIEMLKVKLAAQSHP